MSTFLQAIDLSVWMSVQQDWEKPPTPEGEWDYIQRKAHTNNYKVLNAIFCAISQNEFRRICNLTTTKEVWDHLQVTHEGTNAVKKSKLQMLTTKFEEFRMEENEQFINFYTKLQDIVNSRAALDNALSSEIIVGKILRSLPERFRAKVTTIEVVKDIDTIVVEELVGSLKTFEMTFKSNIRKKGVALKVEDSPNTDEDSDEEFAKIARRFRRFYKNSRDFRNKQRRSSQNLRKKETTKEDKICYKCKGHSHYAKDYGNKKKGKSHSKTMTAGWDNDSDESNSEPQSSDEDISEGIKSFMVLNTSLDSSPCLNESESDEERENADEENIQDAFDKLFEKSLELEKNKRLKMLNKELSSDIFLEDTNSHIQNSNESNTLLTQKGELCERIKEVETKLSEFRMFNNLERTNKKFEKGNLLEENKKLSLKILELERVIKSLKETNDSNSDIIELEYLVKNPCKK